jgi:hypothetical protein
MYEKCFHRDKNYFKNQKYAWKKTHFYKYTSIANK